ncbi:death effector domain-containing 1 isoform X2 [Engraulis encrasicolus]|uniref:death effector domain-containing 1 isoform X2 n=1 Tax=Engraulis encrasicolus TaxID=184585 RepID=UPI002FD23305
MAWSGRRRSLLAPWEDTECFSYYDMLTPHEVYEVVGSQLTDADLDILSFLLEEVYPPTQHPLDPQHWSQVGLGETGDLEVRTPPDPRLLRAWNRMHSRAPPPSASSSSSCAPPSASSSSSCAPPSASSSSSCAPPSSPDAARSRPKCGVRLLLELERRGHLSEANMEPLLRLLRILTRHDLTPFVTRKRRRTVSPEREYPLPPSHVALQEEEEEEEEEEEQDYPEDTRSCHHDDTPLDTAPQGGRHHRSPTQERSPTRCTEGGPPVATPLGPVRRSRRAKGRYGNSRRRRRAPRRVPEPRGPPVSMDTQGPPVSMDTQGPPLPSPEAPGKATCNIRLRVRPEYCEQEAVLRAVVSSDKRDPLARRLELFNRANAALRGRDLGAVHCDIRFSELSKLDALWVDYLI